MHIIEVAFYAILAGFIFSKLYSSFGEEVGATTTQNGNDEAEESTEVIQDDFKYVDEENLDSMKSIIDQIKARDPSFSSDSFVEGAERAFEAILKAYHDKDTDTIRNLVDKDLLDTLTKKIEERKNQKIVHKNVIISIIKKELSKIELVKNDINATMKFVSEQMDIVEGGDEKSEETSVVEDIWKFRKSIKSKQPKWLLYEMN